MAVTTDQIEEYYIDILGWSQDECSELTTDELVGRLGQFEIAEMLEFAKTA